MIKLKVSQVAKILQSSYQGADTMIEGVSIDTRTLVGKELFFAICGPQHDGHEYVAAAAAAGAAAAVVQRQVDVDLPQIIVQDTRAALADLARAHRSQFTKPIVALTGSCGKTTTKMLIATVLNQKGEVYATQGNLNNDYGVPLTLLRMDMKADYAVIEMGANHPNEIAYLTHIAKPTIALITNAGPVHLEGFLSVEGVAKAKGEIFQGLSEEGIAVINYDDTYCDYWISITAGNRYVTFGLSAQADVYADSITYDDHGASQFILHTLTGSIQINFPLIGEHNLRNAVAAAAVATCLDVPLTAIKAGLEQAQAVDKRFVEKENRQGAKIIDDTYNANPAAMEMALKVLSKKNGQKILVVGDMGELGSDSVFYHQDLGSKAKQYGVDKLYAVGELSKHTVQSFGINGFHFATQQLLIEALSGDVSNNMTILVKGSRSAKMENIVNALLKG